MDSGVSPSTVGAAAAGSMDEDERERSWGAVTAVFDVCKKQERSEGGRGGGGEQLEGKTNFLVPVAVRCTSSVPRFGSPDDDVQQCHWKIPLILDVLLQFV